jgi:hypothetical protein
MAELSPFSRSLFETDFSVERMRSCGIIGEYTNNPKCLFRLHPLNASCLKDVFR